MNESIQTLAGHPKASCVGMAILCCDPRRVSLISPFATALLNPIIEILNINAALPHLTLRANKTTHNGRLSGTTGQRYWYLGSNQEFIRAGRTVTVELWWSVTLRIVMNCDTRITSVTLRIMMHQKQELRPNTKEQMLKRFKENLNTFKKTFDYLKDKWVHH